MRAMHDVQLTDRKRSGELILMSGLNETIDQIALTNNVYLYGYVLWRGNVHVMRTALDFDVK